MADENEEIEDGVDGEEAEGGKKKPGIMKLALFIGLPVLILVLGGTAAFLLLSGGGDNADQLAEAGEHGEVTGEHGGGGSHASGSGANLTVATLPDLIVSITDANGRNSLLTLQLSFETPDADLLNDLVEEDGVTLTADGRRLVDLYMGFLRELRPDDLSGSAGYQRIRMELLRRAELVLGEERVSAVLITNVLIV